VGVAVDNAYGVVFHSTVLARLGVADAEIDGMRSGQEPADDRQAAIYQLAQDIVRSRGKVPADTIDAPPPPGSPSSTSWTWWPSVRSPALVRVIDNLAGRVELDSFFAPRAWS
jgi:hypothetical protein